MSETYTRIPPTLPLKTPYSRVREIEIVSALFSYFSVSLKPLFKPCAELTMTSRGRLKVEGVGIELGMKCRGYGIHDRYRIDAKVLLGNKGGRV